MATLSDHYHLYGSMDSKSVETKLWEFTFHSARLKNVGIYVTTMLIFYSTDMKEPWVTQKIHKKVENYKNLGIME